MIQPGINQPDRERYQLFVVYTYYRLALSLTLVILYLADIRQWLHGSFEEQLYIATASAYSLFNFITLLVLFGKRFNPNTYFLFFNFLTDIAALIIITHVTGGISGNVSILITITVAAAGIFIVGNVATLVAAMATIAVLAEALIYGYIWGNLSEQVLQAGILGLLFFATSLLIQGFTAKIRANQELARLKSRELAELQALNERIVKRMRTGILVAARDMSIRTINKSASLLLGLHHSNNISELRLPDTLASQLDKWLQDQQLRFPPFTAYQDGPQLQVNFTKLARDDNSEILVFVEDIQQVAQQAQQLKLASLGRLTASIAHEIRNPLSAISHAAQLMQESETLDSADQRLANIVQSHSERVNNIIENVLSLSRRAPANVEKLDLNDWLQEFIDDFSDANKLDARLISTSVVPETLQVSADRGQLRQVLLNICQNGVRYSEKQTGKASLTISAYQDAINGLPVMDIIDDGAGIKDSDKTRIFEPFFTTENAGTGLGLYLAKELCEANQVRLDYLTTEQGKSCFRLSFPHPNRRPLTTTAPTFNNELTDKNTVE
jgi:two-component system sensor histidine kinase PilS (NtrC family)